MSFLYCKAKFSPSAKIWWTCFYFEIKNNKKETQQGFWTCSLKILMKNDLLFLYDRKKSFWFSIANKKCNKRLEICTKHLMDDDFYHKFTLLCFIIRKTNYIFQICVLRHSFHLLYVIKSIKIKLTTIKLLFGTSKRDKNLKAFLVPTSHVMGKYKINFLTMQILHNEFFI